jgi:hypothetical protein
LQEAHGKIERAGLRSCAELWELIGQQDRNPQKNFWEIIVGGSKKIREIIFPGVTEIPGKYF